MALTTKGVQFYGYIGQSGMSINFEEVAPGVLSSSVVAQTTFSQPGQISQGGFQIGNDALIAATLRQFQWAATNGGSPVANNSVAINPTTGNLVGGGMANMLQTPSIVTSTAAVSYGFYDAGSGACGLTNQDQCYVYQTINYSNWITTLAQNNADVVNRTAFSAWVLPGAHDAGMCSFSLDWSTIMAAVTAYNVTAQIPGLLSLGNPLIQNIITNYAWTQKDTITMMLNLGIRYFDFRPGYVLGDTTGALGIFHQHLFVPGYTLSGFMTEILTWLAANKGEIVVVSFCYSGFQSPSMQPGSAAIYAVVNQVSTSLGNPVVFGNANDIAGNGYGSLMSQNKRLIFLNTYDEPTDSFLATKYDSYGDSAYTTATPASVQAALGQMNKAAYQAGNFNYTVMQLQGTPQLYPDGLSGFMNALTYSQTSSPLMSIKPQFDCVLYPWCLANVHNNLDMTTAPNYSWAQNLIVLLNDFADNALVANAIAICEQRFQSIRQYG
jgi:hypothetical protein